jgi:hypothetical protein
MINKLKRIPVPVMVLILLALLYPAFTMFEKSRLKARIDNNCLNFEEHLEDCYLTYYQKTAYTQGTKVALTQLHDRKEKDQLLAVNCHEAMHEIGHAAFHEYGSIGEAYATLITPAGVDTCMVSSRNRCAGESSTISARTS